MSNLIGKFVIKKSHKPFKSKLKVNTIKEVTVNPNTGKPAYSFIEDNSVVDVHQCEIVAYNDDLGFPEDYIETSDGFDEYNEI